MAVYVGRWDCTTCGYKGVLGPQTECSNCGADRPKNVKFYLADENDIVQDPAVLKKARAGADWRCSYCSDNNPSDTVTCKSCGNTRGQDDRGLEVKDYDTKDVPRTGDGTKEKKVQTSSVSKKPPFKITRKHLFIGGAIFLFLMLILGYNKGIVVNVEGFDWKRTIKVEQYQLVEEEDWSVPSEGTLLNSFEAIHHYNQILDHYETRYRTEQRAVGSEDYVCGKTDMGNGYFEDKYCSRTIYESYEEAYEEPIYRQEPVYATKYRYSIWRWKPVSPLITSGNNQETRWGDTQNIEADANLREGGREGVYGITVRDEKNVTHHHEIPEQKWIPLKIGDKLQAKRGLLGDYRGLDEKVL